MRTLNIMMTAILVTIVLPSPYAAAEDHSTRPQEMPVIVWYCDSDPGTQDIHPGGGKGIDPDTLARKHGCEPAAGVAITFTADDLFARCDTDRDGQCSVTTPSSFDRELHAAVHMSTVKPGYVVPDRDMVTKNVTEFAGFGLALVRDVEGPGDVEARRTLAFEVADASGRPAEVLTQLSPAEISAAGADWLATNPEGWVSYDISDLDPGTAVDLVIRSEGQPASVFCDNGASPEWIVGTEAAFTRITTSDTQTNITCRVALASKN